MNTKDFIRLGIPLGEATRRATDFVSKFILSGGDKSRLGKGESRIVVDRGGAAGAMRDDDKRQWRA